MTGLAVTCPACGALPGDPCVSLFAAELRARGLSTVLPETHASRRAAAREEAAS